MKRRLLYTKKLHAYRLKTMLGSRLNKRICYSCPAAPGFKGNEYVLSYFLNDVCTVCAEFVGIKLDKYSIPFGSPCPCKVFGKKKAIEKSLVALDEFYKDKKDKK
jgi:hypothetical protein